MELRAAIGLAGALLLVACQRRPQAPSETPAPTYQGLFLLNEGQWTLENASLDQIDPAYRANIFYLVNQTTLGDVANYWFRERDTLWIVLNGSKLLRKLQLPTFREIGHILLPRSASPREFLRVSATKAYINSLLDAKIYRINPITLTLDAAPITLENYMESMIQVGDCVWVSCGNYAYPARNNKLGCFRIVDDEVVGYLTLPRENPGPLLLLPNGELLIGCRGNYADQKGLLVHVAPQTGVITDTVPLQTSVYGLYLLRDTVYMLTDSGVSLYDWRRHAVDYQFLSRSKLGLSPHHLIYGFYYDTVSGYWLVANAKSGGVAGEILWVHASGEIQRRSPAGVFPSKFLRYP